ncbi:TlpA family protein disulfide reductase [Shewanella sp. KX20019]|uniref:TlpA family protein disulfide reductase n=1 Tax=Shewanella sp. KX20019 TaxID=2803864 RepID=UPI00192564AF|nr:TlpA disulfide reductase family protein [Shewanella sp. KX20019]QQX80705.1 TlpA family protein disulfide reductase [Shewanella sp. KX20019]
MRSLTLILASLLILTTAGCANNTEHSTTAQKETTYLTYVKTGDKVPVTQFVDIQGNSIDLSQSRNNKLIILFATWCHDSQRTIKHLTASDIYLSPNIDIIGVGREENNPALEKFAAEYELNFTLVADTDRSIYNQFANIGIPRLILLDADNNVVKTLIGESENAITEVVW